MKRYWYLVALVILFGGLFLGYRWWYNTLLERRYAAIQAERDRMMSAPKPDIKEDQVDHYVLKPGDTILVHACKKVFVVKGNGIESVKAISSKDEGIVSITRKSAGEVEIGFSCKTIENALGIYPLLFTSETGKGVTIYFSPMPDLDGSLHYHSNFEIEM